MDARLAVVEAGLSDVRSEQRRDREQRDRDHRENQQLLTTIASDVVEVKREVRTVTSVQADHEARLSDVEEWRKGLIAELRGVLRPFRVVLPVIPVGMFILGVITLVRG